MQAVIEKAQCSVSPSDTHLFEDAKHRKQADDSWIKGCVWCYQCHRWIQPSEQGNKCSNFQIFRDIIETPRPAGVVRLPNNDYDAGDSRDMIDFPCTDEALDFYHFMGLTPRHSPGMSKFIKPRELPKVREAGKKGGVPL